MSEILIFAGTCEGRAVAEFLSERKQRARVCVATEYGESLLPKGEFLEISHERMDREQMEALMTSMGPDCLVIDATHPYAVQVTENIRQACAAAGASYLRLIRPSRQTEGEAVYVKDTAEAVEYLKSTEGDILVTTGSKELEAFCALPDYKNRVYARVLSLPQVAASCAALGFEGKHLICMQGPFSRELNAAMIRQLHTRWLVTKESGAAGGFQEKCLAARDTGSGLVIIGRPRREEGVTLAECLEMLAQRLHVAPPRKEEDREEDRKISLVGIGMGTPDTLTEEGKRELSQAQLLIGARRMLEQTALPGQAVYAAYKPEEIRDYIEAHPEYRRVAIALSGDVGFFSGAKKLVEVLDGQVEIYCGISSLVYFCGRLHTCWEDVLPVSLHGRQRNIPGLLRQHARVFAIVGTDTGAGQICRTLSDCGMGKVQVTLGERLSYEDEKITRGTARELADRKTDPLSVILLENPDALDPVVTHGIPDDAFVRDRIPMTKEEVRSVSLSKLRLTRGARIWDVGAGTGSVSVEMARMAVDGMVYAVEKKEEAAALIEKNREAFGICNLQVIRGCAPEALKSLPAPTHVFIGGSSGNLREIMELVLEKNPGARMVINCITLETMAEALQCIRQLPVEDVDIAQITAAKGKAAGPYHLMMGQNPVTVISCTGRGEEEKQP